MLLGVLTELPHLCQIKRSIGLGYQYSGITTKLICKIYMILASLYHFDVGKD